MKDLLYILRAMAWQRAKGELYSILETYMNERETFEAAKKVIDNFVREVEHNGLVR